MSKGEKMRTTQFIGLNDSAREYVKNLEELPSDAHTYGMFDEIIPLKRWKIPENHPLYCEHEASCIREVFQFEIWSSGPMIFTCLAYDTGNVFEEGKLVKSESNKMYQWTADPTVQGEYDPVLGKYWI